MYGKLEVDELRHKSIDRSDIMVFMQSERRNDLGLAMSWTHHNNRRHATNARNGNSKASAALLGRKEIHRPPAFDSKFT